MGNFGVQMAKTLGMIGGAAPAAAKALPALGGLGGMLGGGAVHPAAALGGAASLGGKLSVPVSWTGAGAAPALGHAACRSAPSAPPPRPPADPGTCSAVCHWPVWAPARTPAPVPATDSAPPSWPDHPLRDNHLPDRQPPPTSAQTSCLFIDALRRQRHSADRCYPAEGVNRRPDFYQAVVTTAPRDTSTSSFRCPGWLVFAVTVL